ncbi:MAG TPA: hypothetical protein VJZ27_15545, partial [Aggregatilineales bacterium]|nr:hypothetical protein [Aggregatilineales bacterium]
SDVFAIKDDDRTFFEVKDDDRTFFEIRDEAPDTDPFALKDDDSALFEVRDEDLDTESEIPEIEVTYHYRVAVVLNPHLETQINEARQRVNIPVAHTGIFELQSEFTTEDSAAVEDTIKTWASWNLPLHVSLETIEAEVIDSQRYVAAVRLEPAEPLIAAQQRLTESLTPHITITADNPLPFRARLLVSDHTPAGNFPRLVHALQQEFDFGEWTILAVELLRTPEGDDRWEVVEKYTHTTP